ncbi:prepilin peptidase [Epibacterium ulvae]|uniref:prepilin peptidase n=1 Tax=Epibacterium ulvae TaxID=1156985 RepID=UPI0024930F7E|nr:A24 family peptidase [Epibacterium ulvae]
MRNQTTRSGGSSLSKRDVRSASGLSLLYVLTFMMFLPYGGVEKLLLAVFLLPFMIWLSVCDLKTFELPDTATVAIAFGSVTYVAFTMPNAVALHMCTAVGVLAFCWLLGEVYYRRVGQEGLGIGDAKLFAAGALLLGPWQLPELILFPALGGIALHIISAAKGAGDHVGIPFGPFISYAMFILFFLDPIFL